MNKAICTVSVAPIHMENNHYSDMTSQLLYGESVDIIEIIDDFSKIKLHFDNYEGWVDSKQISKISEENFSLRNPQIITQFFSTYNLADGKTLLSIGSELDIETENFLQEDYEKNITETAVQFLNVPYLLGGRSFFGIDCSGFTQLVHKVHGNILPREAHQQSEIGEVLNFVEESQAGDLAFFENKAGEIIHVGIMLEEQKIIHCYGKVRIDYLDSSGIFNKELNKHTHKLRFLKRIVQ